jgi:hypothetical protein
MTATVLRNYKDAGLSTLLTVLPGIIGESYAFPIYAGSPDAGIIHRRKTLPLVNQLQAALVDNNTGDVILLENFKFALTEVGLAAATPGAPLNLGTSIESGVENALVYWCQITDTSGVVAEYPGAFTLTILDVEDAPA